MREGSQLQNFLHATVKKEKFEVVLKSKESKKTKQ
jgi:hypothetical protein